MTEYVYDTDTHVGWATLHEKLNRLAENGGILSRRPWSYEP
jgi:hypothetical protein